MDYKLNIRDRRGDNRYFIDNVFLKDWGAKLGPHCIAVYNALAMYANADTQEAWPSFQTIADLVGMSRRQVMREIDKLKDNGIIRVEDRKEIAPETGKPYFLSNVFTLLHPSEWGKPIDLSLYEPSDCESLGVRTGSHQPSDSESHPLVTVSHPNNTNNNNTQITTKSASKPTRPHSIPAVQIFVEITGKYCLSKPQMKEVAEVIGDNPTALEKWRAVVKEWLMRGFKPTNVAGMLEWFRGEIPVYQNGAKNGQQSTKDHRPEFEKRREAGQSVDDEFTAQLRDLRGPNLAGLTSVPSRP